MRYYLELEKKLQPLERRMEEIRKFHDISHPHHAKELAALAKKISKVEQEVYGDSTNWQRAQLSRHLNRPHTLDYINRLFKDFMELKGDRTYRDDPAIVAGLSAGKAATP